MRLEWRRIVAGSALAVYFIGLDFLSGVAVERMRFDGKRQVIIARLHEKTDRVHARLMDLERTAERSLLADAVLARGTAAVP